MGIPMDIHKELVGEHSKASRDRIVAYVRLYPDRFDVLFDLFRNGEIRVAQRAAWSVSHCAERYPDLVVPYIPNIVNYLQQ